MIKAALRIVMILVLTSTVAVPAFAADAKKTILVVDMGNIMRSVIAEQLIAKKIAENGLADRYDVISRGLQGTPALPVVPTHANLSYFNKANGSNAWESSLPALKKLGIADAFTKRKATVVSAADLKKAAIIIVTDPKVMDDPQYGLNAQFPGYSDKMVLITALVGSQKGISDAYQEGSGGNKYESTVYQVADVVERGFDNLMKRLQ